MPTDACPCCGRLYEEEAPVEEPDELALKYWGLLERMGVLTLSHTKNKTKVLLGWVKQWRSLRRFLGDDFSEFLLAIKWAETYHRFWWENRLCLSPRAWLRQIKDEEYTRAEHLLYAFRRWKAERADRAQAARATRNAKLPRGHEASYVVGRE